MTKSTHLIISILTCAFLICTMGACRPRAGHNLYREKVKPSELQMREDKKIMKRSQKNYKKQLRANRKRLFGRSTDPEAPKPQK
jgi:hypothetical protein